MSPGPARLLVPGWQDYALLDSGRGAKLERFGPYRLVRPAPEAAWEPALPAREWEAAEAVFRAGSDPSRGRWQLRRPLPERWPVAYGAVRAWVRPTPFRHVGLFPEQAPHWEWIARCIGDTPSDPALRVLSLFAYTGMATLVAAAAGAGVTHVDASRKTVAWARENQELSGLLARPVRWIVDDAPKFARREVRRGARYDGFILDPPPFGHGPEGEIWRLETALPALLETCRALLTDRPRFVVVTTYATRSTTQWLGEALAGMMRGQAGRLTAGEVALREQSAGRALPAASFARWSAR